MHVWKWLVAAMAVGMLAISGCNKQSASASSTSSAAEWGIVLTQAQQAQVDAIPKFAWFGEWTHNPEAVAREIIAESPTGIRPGLVLYFITNRDMGQFSTGGASGMDAYKKYVTEFSQGIGSCEVDVVIEPDGLAHAASMTGAKRAERIALIRFAVEILTKDNPKASVYVDIGHSNWLPVDQAAQLLKEVGAPNFALNVSNFREIHELIIYAEKLHASGCGKALIDTSRNGCGPDPQNRWCNPPDRGLGQKPTTNTGSKAVAAFAWVKNPAESDGNENGAPRAGEKYPQYLKQLYDNSPYFGRKSK